MPQQNQKLFQTFSQHFGIPKAVFEQTGAFDILPGSDTQLYLEPKALLDVKDENFRGASQYLTDYFSKMIAGINHPGLIDPSKMLVSKEICGACLGVSRYSMHGRAIGPQCADAIIAALGAIAKRNRLDPQVFEILNSFLPGISSDRISDMLIYILQDFAYSYNEKMIGKLHLENQRTVLVTSKISGHRYHLLFNDLDQTKMGSYLVLLPKELLSDYPAFAQISNNRGWYYHSDSARTEMAEFIKPEEARNVPLMAFKEAAFKAILTKSDILSAITDFYEQMPAFSYDFTKDGSYLNQWSDAIDILQNRPWFSALSKSSTITNARDFVAFAAEKLNELVHTSSLWRSIVDSNQANAEFAYCILLHLIGQNMNFKFDFPEVHGEKGFAIRGPKGDQAVALVRSLSNSSIFDQITPNGLLYKMAFYSEAKSGLLVVIGNSKTPRADELIKRYNSLSSGAQSRLLTVFVDPTSN